MSQTKQKIDVTDGGGQTTTSTALKEKQKKNLPPINIASLKGVANNGAFIEVEDVDQAFSHGKQGNAVEKEGQEGKKDLDSPLDIGELEEQLYAIMENALVLSYLDGTEDISANIKDNSATRNSECLQVPMHDRSTEVK